MFLRINCNKCQKPVDEITLSEYANGYRLTAHCHDEEDSMFITWNDLREVPDFMQQIQRQIGIAFFKKDEEIEKLV